MRALKVLVIVMGVALVAGTVALVAAIVVKVEHRGATAASAAPFRAALPAGSRIVATEFSGERVLVHVALADGGEALYLFDAKTGAELGVVAAAPGR